MLEAVHSVYSLSKWMNEWKLLSEIRGSEDYPPKPKAEYPLNRNAKYNNTRYNNKGSKEEEIILGRSIIIEDPIIL